MGGFNLRPARRRRRRPYLHGPKQLNFHAGSSGHSELPSRTKRFIDDRQYDSGHIIVPDHPAHQRYTAGDRVHDTGTSRNQLAGLGSSDRRHLGGQGALLNPVAAREPVAVLGAAAIYAHTKRWTTVVRTVPMHDQVPHPERLDKLGIGADRRVTLRHGATAGGGHGVRRRRCGRRVCGLCARGSSE